LTGKKTQNNNLLDSKTIISEFSSWNRELETQIQWVSLLYEAGMALKSGKHHAHHFEIFFIKLYGMITETEEFVKHHYLKKEHLMKLTAEDLNTLKIDGEYHLHSETLYFLSDFFKNCVNEKEKRVVEFLRNKACHLITKKYLISYDSRGEFQALTDKFLKSHLYNEIMDDLGKMGGPTQLALNIFNRIEIRVLQFRGALIWYADRLGLKLHGTIRD
jgi:hypothetical protein